MLRKDEHKRTRSSAGSGDGGGSDAVTRSADCGTDGGGGGSDGGGSAGGGEVDLEGGLALLDKKELSGSFPIVIQLWDLLRKHVPFVLPYVGSMPPRFHTMRLRAPFFNGQGSVSRVGQAVLLYMAILHVMYAYHVYVQGCGVR